VSRGGRRDRRSPLLIGILVVTIPLVVGLMAWVVRELSRTGSVLTRLDERTLDHERRIANLEDTPLSAAAEQARLTLETAAMEARKSLETAAEAARTTVAHSKVDAAAIIADAAHDANGKEPSS